jgi:hypothetical protein
VFEVGPGDCFLVPGSVENQAAALEDCEMLDIFTTMRDYARA